jgi:trehalose 6-phosphate phosphatase
MPVAVLSGRHRADVAALVGLPDLIYAGTHGFDIKGPEIRLVVDEDIARSVDWATRALEVSLSGVRGVLVEPKRFTVAVHYRMATEADLPRIEAAVDDALATCPGLKKTYGKKVFELRPAIDWDKGKALRWLLEHLRESAGGADLPIYLGDDDTDEDAFRAIAGNGIGILVADEPRATAAEYGLRDPEEAREWLARLAG